MTGGRFGVIELGRMSRTMVRGALVAGLPRFPGKDDSVGFSVDQAVMVPSPVAATSRASGTPVPGLATAPNSILSVSLAGYGCNTAVRAMRNAYV